MNHGIHRIHGKKGCGSVGVRDCGNEGVKVLLEGDVERVGIGPWTAKCAAEFLTGLTRLTGLGNGY